MGYLNGNTGYRENLLETRSIVKKDNYVVLTQDGLVNNSVPGYENCQVSILGTPAMGASFVDYIVTAKEGGRNSSIGGDGIESFIYVIEGKISIKIGDVEEVLEDGGYVYSPSNKSISFENLEKTDAKLYVYRRRYEELEGYKIPDIIINNVKDIDWVEYEGMKNCLIKDLLPASGDYKFDMNMHILKFEPGASHGYIETHIQEHGMLFLTGKAMYNLDNDWMPLEKGDYVFMDSYCPQACYGVGDEDLTYIYSKDCNRDIKL